MDLVESADWHGCYQLAREWVISEGVWRMTEHVIVLIVVVRVLKSLLTIESRGKLGLFSYFTKLFLRFANNFSFVKNKKIEYLEKESTKSAEQVLGDKEVKAVYKEIPKHGLAANDILSILDKRVKADIDPKAGQTFAYVYEASKAHNELTEQCFLKYMHHNTLNPVLFNSLRVIENEVVTMCAKLFHGDDKCVGSVTSCGTESLILAMKTYRDYRGKGEVIMCNTGHPGINKGCHYVGLDVVQIPTDKTLRLSLKHLKKAISSKTVLVVASAPQYPHGVVDDIPEIAKICRSYGVPLHVDSAIGGFVLPFLEMEGRAKFKPFDFRVPGVTSINADIHKYGYAPKGSSVLIFKNSTIRNHQFFAFSTWPGGIYLSPTIMGTRNGGTLSSAWGSLLDLGVNGFRTITTKILVEVDKIVAFVKECPDLELMAEPDSTLVSFRCKNFRTYLLTDALDARGLYMEKNSNPDCIHMTIMPNHIGKMDNIIVMVKECLQEVKKDPSKYEKGTKAMYGMMASIPDEAIVEDFVVHLMDKMYKA